MELELATFDLPLAIDNARTFVRERPPGTESPSTLIRRAQILLNLLSKRREVYSGGRIRINAQQANGAVEISVSDTGIGIAPEDQSKALKSFAR